MQSYTGTTWGRPFRTSDFPLIFAAFAPKPMSKNYRAQCRALPAARSVETSLFRTISQIERLNSTCCASGSKVVGSQVMHLTIDAMHTKTDAEPIGSCLM